MLKLRDSLVTKKSVEVIMTQMRKIRETHGLLTPSLVVEAAKDPESPLHRYFEWDDTAAANKYRLAQARQLIGRVRIDMGSSEKPEMVRVFASVVEDNQRSYKSVTEIRSSAELTQQVLEQASADIRSFQKRYERFDGLFKVTEAANKIAEELDALIEGTGEDE